MNVQKRREITLVDPSTEVKAQAASFLKLKHQLLQETARRKVSRNRGRTASKRRDRRLVRTGEVNLEAPWREPVETHPGVLPQDDGFSISVSDEGHRLQQRRRQRKARAAYWAVLGVTPSLLPGDRIGAAIWHRKLVAVIEQGGWSHNEQTALADMERKWRRRARGEDARFVLAGNRAGRLPKSVEARVERLTEREG